MFSFEVTKKFGSARLSSLTTPHGVLSGPFFPDISPLCRFFLLLPLVELSTAREATPVPQKWLFFLNFSGFHHSGD